MGINLKEHLSQWINSAGWFHVKIKSVEASRSDNDKPYLEYHFEDIANGRQGKARFYTTDAAMWVLANFCADIGLSDEKIEDFERNYPIGLKPWVRMELEENYHNAVEWKPDSETAPADVVAWVTEKAKESTRAIDRDDDSGQPEPVEEEVDDEESIPF